MAPRKIAPARRFEHACPTHGWETCAGPTAGERHPCSKLGGDRTLKSMEVREVTVLDP